MCGLAGILLGSQPRASRDYELIGRLLERLLVLSERRGPHATGVALIRRDGTCRVAKAAAPARAFIRSPAYSRLLAAADQRTTILVGHTRFATRGCVSNNANNHPVRAGAVLGTHNGTIRNADRLFEQFGFVRKAEVDSEIVFRFAERRSGPDGIDIPGWLDDIALCQGDLAAAAVSLAQPTQLLLVRRDRPLAIGYNPEMHLLIYASEVGILQRAVGASGAWAYSEIGPLQALRFDCDDLPAADTWLLPALPSARWERYHGQSPED